jgi:hypothetical protein
VLDSLAHLNDGLTHQVEGLLAEATLVLAALVLAALVLAALLELVPRRLQFWRARCRLDWSASTAPAPKLAAARASTPIPFAIRVIRALLLIR